MVKNIQYKLRYMYTGHSCQLSWIHHQHHMLYYNLAVSSQLGNFSQISKITQLVLKIFQLSANYGGASWVPQSKISRIFFPKVGKYDRVV
jgi:hypothetical protein